MFDDNIPIKTGKGNKKKYNLDGIKVGQSKWFPYEPETVSTIAIFRSSLIMSAIYSHRNIADVKFSTSKEIQEGKEGIRIWRIS